MAQTKNIDIRVVDTGSVRLYEGSMNAPIGDVITLNTNATVVTSKNFIRDNLVAMYMSTGVVDIYKVNDTSLTHIIALEYPASSAEKGMGDIEFDKDGNIYLTTERTVLRLYKSTYTRETSTYSNWSGVIGYAPSTIGWQTYATRSRNMVYSKKSNTMWVYTNGYNTSTTYNVGMSLYVGWDIDNGVVRLPKIDEILGIYQSTNASVRSELIGYVAGQDIEAEKSGLAYDELNDVVYNLISHSTDKYTEPKVGIIGIRSSDISFARGFNVGKMVGLENLTNISDKIKIFIGQNSSDILLMVDNILFNIDWNDKVIGPMVMPFPKDSIVTFNKIKHEFTAVAPDGTYVASKTGALINKYEDYLGIRGGFVSTNIESTVGPSAYGYGRIHRVIKDINGTDYTMVVQAGKTPTGVKQKVKVSIGTTRATAISSPSIVFDTVTDRANITYKVNLDDDTWLPVPEDGVDSEVYLKINLTNLPDNGGATVECGPVS